MIQEAGSTPSRERPMLKLRNVSKKFGAVSALTDIDLDVHPGEVVALVGANGAGKSTLLKLLTGEIQPDEGKITLAPTLDGIVIDQQIIPGANHFFDGKLQPLMETVTGYLDMRLANVR